MPAFKFPGEGESWKDPSDEFIALKGKVLRLIPELTSTTGHSAIPGPSPADPLTHLCLDMLKLLVNDPGAAFQIRNESIRTDIIPETCKTYLRGLKTSNCGTLTILNISRMTSRNIDDFIHQAGMTMLQTQVFGQYERHTGWEHTLIISGRHTLRIYAGEQGLIVFTNTMTWKLYYRLLAIALKKYTEMHEATSPEFGKFLTALGNEDANTITNLLTNLENWPSIKNKRNNTLYEIFAKSPAKQMFDLRKRYEDLDNRIENTLAQLAQQYTERDSVAEQIFLLENFPKQKQTLEELDPYLNGHPLITEVRPGENGCLEVEVVAPLRYWDDSILDTILRKRYDATTKLMLRAVFKKQKYRIYCYSTLEVDIVRKTVNVKHIDHHTTTALPHPHLKDFSCMGNNRTQIVSAITDRDFMRMFEQIIVAAYNINLIDTPVWNRFIKKFFETELKHVANINCIEVVETGERITIAEMIRRERNVKEEIEETTLDLGLPTGPTEERED